MAKLFYVEYLVGGSSNFEAKRIKGLHDVGGAQKHIDDLRKMGYPAMMVNPAIGGFEFANSFTSDQERVDYFNNIKSKFL